MNEVIYAGGRVVLTDSNARPGECSNLNCIPLLNVRSVSTLTSPDTKPYSEGQFSPTLKSDTDSRALTPTPMASASKESEKARTNPATAQSINQSNPKSTSSRKGKFRCTYPGCNKTYRRRTHLQRHIHSHDCDAQYICPHENCKRGFHRRDHFEYHLRVHSGEKPYKCPEEGCGRAFRQRSALNRHLQSHLRQECLTCSHCLRVFSSKKELVLHVYTAHGTATSKQLHAGMQPFIHDVSFMTNQQQASQTQYIQQLLAYQQRMQLRHQQQQRYQQPHLSHFLRQLTAHTNVAEVQQSICGSQFLFPQNTVQLNSIQTITCSAQSKCFSESEALFHMSTPQQASASASASCSLPLLQKPEENNVAQQLLSHTEVLKPAIATQPQILEQLQRQLMQARCINKDCTSQSAVSIYLEQLKNQVASKLQKVIQDLQEKYAHGLSPPIYQPLPFKNV
eukprot:gene4238-8489_t